MDEPESMYSSAHRLKLLFDHGHRPSHMRVRKSLGGTETPSTRSDLHQWVRDRIHLPSGQEQALLDAIDNVFMQHERLWQQSKQEAIQAVSAGFTDSLNRCREELPAREPTVSSIPRYLRD